MTKPVRSRSTIGLLLVLACTASACSSAPTKPGWTELFDGRTLGDWAVTVFGGEGEVQVEGGAMLLDFGSPLTGVHWQGQPPSGDYELEVVAARVEGTDFFCGLTFPVGDRHLSLILGGWGGSVCGLSCLDGQDAARNETRTLRGFKNDRDYHVRLEVTAARVTVELDGKPLLRADVNGRSLSLRPEVELSRPLGIAAFATRARIRQVRWRPLRPERRR